MKPFAQRGFTLVEMLVALALVALLSVAMLQAYRFSQRTLLQTTRIDAGTRDIAGAQRLLRRLIEQAYPFEPGSLADSAAPSRGLSGNSTQLAISAPAAAQMGGAGFYRYDIVRTDEGLLEVGWVLDRNGAKDAWQGEMVRRESILDGVRSVSVAYLELVETGSGHFEANWRDSWLDESSLPAVVRIRVAFFEGDRRKWPELIVAPRISTDANCVFDLVSQMCRIGS